MIQCPLCERKCPESVIEEHHLDIRRKSDRTVDICKQCHKTIHGLFSNVELRNKKLNLNTIEGLLNNDRFQKSLKFLKKKDPTEFIRMKESNKRGNRNTY